MGARWAPRARGRCGRSEWSRAARRRSLLDHRTRSRGRPLLDHRRTGGHPLMDTAEIRRRFLAHFEAAGHQAVSSASLLVPDPTLLFVNARTGAVKTPVLGPETP